MNPATADAAPAILPVAVLEVWNVWMPLSTTSSAEMMLPMSRTIAPNVPSLICARCDNAVVSSPSSSCHLVVSTVAAWSEDVTCGSAKNPANCTDCRLWPGWVNDPVVNCFAPSKPPDDELCCPKNGLDSLKTPPRCTKTEALNWPKRCN